MKVARFWFVFSERLCNLRILHIGRMGPKQRVVLGGKIFGVTGGEAGGIKKDVGLSWRPSSDKNWPRSGRHSEGARLFIM